MTTTFTTTHEKEHKKQQHCPACNRYVKYSSRYTNYICQKCVLLAVDKDDKKVGFANITHDGHGVQGVYTESGKLYRTVNCFIKGIKCVAQEHRFGGIVITPIEDAKPKTKVSGDNPKSKKV